MPLIVTHAKVSAIADDPTASAAGDVLPSDWNASHTLSGTANVAQGGTGTGTAFTAGSVVFAGASGVYSQDNTNFFWDDAGNMLKIAGELDFQASTAMFRVGGANLLDYGITNAGAWTFSGAGMQLGSSSYIFMAGVGSNNHIFLNNSSSTYFGGLSCFTSGALMAMGFGRSTTVGGTITGSFFTSETGMSSFGGWNSASFPGLINSGAELRARLSDDSADANFRAKSVRGTAVAFASLPASPVEGMLVGVTDSSVNTWGTTITGGGANHVLAYYNGTNWTVAGK